MQFLLISLLTWIAMSSVSCSSQSEEITVNMPQITVWICLLIFLALFSVSSIAFVKIARTIKHDGDIGACIGCGVIGIVTGAVTIQMGWGLFARCMQYPEY